MSTALAESLAALPAGLPLSLAVRTPGIRQLLGVAHRRLASNRAQWSRWLGLAPLDALEPGVSAGPSPARRWIGVPIVWLRELAVLAFMIAIGSQVLMENKIVPKRLKLGQATWMTAIVYYPRLFQGWSMFTPDAPTGERMLYIDAVTFDGRHVDPFNQEGSRISTLPVERIPGYMDQNEFWCDYTNRIPDNSVNWPPLKDWIFKYSERTHRPEDRIVSYEARLLESDSPPPGQTGSRNIRTKVISREHE